MLKGKILAQLKAKFPGVPNSVLELVATKLAATVTEESAIEGAIQNLDNSPISITEYADLLQKEGDRRVTEAKKKFETEKEGQQQQQQQGQQGNEGAAGGSTGSGTDALAKQLAEINQKLQSLEQKETRNKLTEKLHKALAEKKIPLALAKGRFVESEDQLEGLLAEIEADHTALMQDLANEGFSKQPKPGSGAGGDPSKKAVESDIKAWASSMQPQPVNGAGATK